MSSASIAIALSLATGAGCSRPQATSRMIVNPPHMAKSTFDAILMGWPPPVTGVCQYSLKVILMEYQ
jgi:hypothetical protein